MRLERWLLVIVVWVVLLSISCFAQSSSSQATKTNYDDPERQQAMQFYQEHKLPEAAALLEKVVARYPEDVVAHEALGSSLLSRAATWIDPAKRKADRIHARAELLRAKELGTTPIFAKLCLPQFRRMAVNLRFPRTNRSKLPCSALKPLSRAESLRTPLQDTSRPLRSIPNSTTQPLTSATVTFA